MLSAVTLTVLTGYRDGHTESSAGALIHLTCHAAGNATAGPQCLLAAQPLLPLQSRLRQRACYWLDRLSYLKFTSWDSLWGLCHHLFLQGAAAPRPQAHTALQSWWQADEHANCVVAPCADEMDDSLGSSWPHAGCWRSIRGRCSTCAHLMQRAEGLAPLAVQGEAGSQHRCFYRLQLDSQPC